jgi:hypothetical protein
MPPKTRFMIHVPGRTDIGCDTAGCGIFRLTSIDGFLLLSYRSACRQAS